MNVTIKGRTYTFTTEDAERREAVSTVGSLYNSRGQWAGYVVRNEATGNLSLIHGPRVSLAEERKALSALQDHLSREE